MNYHRPDLPGIGHATDHGLVGDLGDLLLGHARQPFLQSGIQRIARMVCGERLGLVVARRPPLFLIMISMITWRSPARGSTFMRRSIHSRVVARNMARWYGQAGSLLDNATCYLQSAIRTMANAADGGLLDIAYLSSDSYGFQFHRARALNDSGDILLAILSNSSGFGLIAAQRVLSGLCQPVCLVVQTPLPCIGQHVSHSAQRDGAQCGTTCL